MVDYIFIRYICIILYYSYYYALAYGNIFVRGGGGFRVKQANNVNIYNNYIDSSSTLNGAAPSPGIVFDVFNASYHQNVNVMHNTFIETPLNDISTVLSTDTVTFANNIFYSPTKSSMFLTTPSTTGYIKWYGNDFHNNDATFNPPPTGNVNADPTLVKRSDGYYTAPPISTLTPSRYQFNISTIVLY